MGGELSLGEDVFIVGSMPFPVCKLSREYRTKVGRENFETTCEKGYCAVDEPYYIGYKLHPVTSLKGCTETDITKGSEHDFEFLKDIGNGGQVGQGTLLGDTGYLSRPCQIDLFESVQIKLETPMGINPKDFAPQPYIFRKCRKRIETIFSQLCDQFMIKRNYAKTFAGLGTRIITKITGLTLLQYFS